MIHLGAFMPTCPYCGKLYKSDTKHYRNHIDNCESNPQVVTFNSLKHSIRSNIYHALNTATSLIEFLSTLSTEYARVGVLVNYTRIPPLVFNNHWGCYQWDTVEADIRQTTYDVFGTTSPIKFHDLVNRRGNKLDISLNGIGSGTIMSNILPAFHEQLMANPEMVIRLNEHKLQSAWNKYVMQVRSSIKYTVSYHTQVTSIENLQKELYNLSKNLDKVLAQVKSNIEQQILADNIPSVLCDSPVSELTKYLPALTSFRPKDIGSQPYYDKALKLTQEARSYIADYPELFL